MRRMPLFMVLLGILSSSCSGSSGLEDDRTIKMIQEEIESLKAGYLAYLTQYIIPALQQGAGGSVSTPMMIPPIFDAGRQPNPQVPPRIQELLEPVGRSIAYAGFLCRGLGLSKDVDMNEVYVSFTSFSRSRNKFLKELLFSNGDPENLHAELAKTTVSCSQLLKKVCTQGACNSGKCGYSKALGAACVYLCEEDHLQGIKICANDFYRGQVIPKSLLGGVGAQNMGPQQSLYGRQQIPYGQQQFAYGAQPYGQQWPSRGGQRPWGQ